MATIRSDLDGVVVIPGNPPVILAAGDTVPADVTIGDHVLDDQATSAGDTVPAKGRAPVEPPRSGPGSGAKAWAAHAASLGIEVPDGASRDDVIALVDARKE